MALIERQNIAPSTLLNIETLKEKKAFRGSTTP